MPEPDQVPVSVVETPEFLAATRHLMDEQERLSLIITSPIIPMPATWFPELAASANCGGGWQGAASVAARG